MIYKTGKEGILESIGKDIRDIIKKKGISLYQIAKDLGITWESLYRSLQDEANPEWKRIKQILGYLNYEIVLKPKGKVVKSKKAKLTKSKG